MPSTQYYWPLTALSALVSILWTLHLNGGAGLSWLPVIFGALLVCWPNQSKLPKILGVVVIVGALAALVQVYHRLQWHLPNETETHSAQMIATVEDIRANTLIFKAHKTWMGGKQVSYPARVQLYDTQNRHYERGQQWWLEATLKPNHGLNNPGSPNKAQQAFIQGIRAQGKIKEAQCLQGPSIGMRFQNKLRANTERALENIRNGAVLKAMLLGQSTEVTSEQRRLFQSTGTAHLMAISGLHVGCVTGAVFSIARLVLPARLASILAMLVCLLYASLAGATLPTQRATIMMGCLLLSPLTGRSISVIDRVSLSALLICFYDPLSVHAIGFWLSFGAVSFLVAANTWAEGSALKRFIRFQGAAFIGLLPVTLYFFQVVSLAAPVSNAFAIPAISAMLPVAFISALIAQVWTTGAHLLLVGVDKGMSAMLWALEALSHWQVYLPAPSPMATCLASFGALWLLLPQGFPKKLAFLCFLPLFAPGAAVPPNSLNITILEVGQGLSVVLQTQKHTLIYDTGPRTQWFDAGKQVLVPFLVHEHIRKVDKLVLSHLDLDHHGGTHALLERIKVDDIDSSEPYRNSSPCLAGDEWTWDGVQFEYLHPTADDWDLNRNNRSCVLKVSLGDKSLLLTGDIEAIAEERIVENERERLKSTHLLSPHHGSKSSSSEAFIQAVDPEAVVISSGFLNAYHHPHPSVMKRYQHLNIKTYNTAQKGAYTQQWHAQ